MSKEDFAHGVEKASFIYQSVINEYVTENAKLRELVKDMYHEIDALTQHDAGGSRGIVDEYRMELQKLEIEVGA